jgi:hypothetical protein
MYDSLGYVAWYMVTNVSEEHSAFEDGDSMFLRRVSNDQPDFTVISQLMEVSTAVKTSHFVESIYLYS